MNRLSAVLSCLLAAGASAQSEWWVDPAGSDANSGSMASPFQTINHAASLASNGDVIRLVAATYGDEQGNVLLGNVDLRIIGAGRGLTVINADTTAGINLEGGTLGSPTIEEHRCAVAIDGPATIEMRGMTLDQGFSIPGSGRAYSMWVGGGADVSCADMDFINARANPINGIQGPLGINIRGNAGADITNVTLSDCRVNEFGKGGIVANYDAHLAMDACQVRGYNHAVSGLAAQNCVQVSRGATCEIRRCQIADSWYDPSSGVATGFLIFDPGASIVIEDCDVANCQVGIYFFASSPTAIAGVVRRNRVANTEFGIYVSEVSGLDVIDNSFAVLYPDDENDAWDDGSANTWDNNFYSSLSADGPYVLPGTAGSADANAKAKLREFGMSATTALPAGLTPIDMATGDLDGTGAADVAVLAQGGTPTIVVGTNAGGGTFTMTALPFGNSDGEAVALVLGDFVPGGGLDVAAVTRTVPPAVGENAAYVFANDGAGNLTLHSTLVLTGVTTLSGVDAGDADGDGQDDLVVSDTGSSTLIAGTASFLSNDGTGSFTQSALAGTFTVACRDAAFGEFTGDADLDIAVIEGNATTGLMHVFAGDGAGGFTDTASPVSVAANPQRALAADVGGDGDTDLLVSSTRDAFGLDAGGIDVVLHDGAGNFETRLYWVDNGPTAIAAGDLGDDADPDTVRRDVAFASLVGGSVGVLGNWSEDGAGSGGIAEIGRAHV